MASKTLTIKFNRIGVGISNTDVEYADSTSNKTAPSSGWQTNAPAWQNGHYIWTRTHIYYTDGNERITDPVCLPSGKGIAKIEEWYYQSSSATSLAGGSWVKDKAPTWKDGWYVWTKSIITYTDGSTTSSAPVCATGGKGEKGDKGNQGEKGKYMRGPQDWDSLSDGFTFYPLNNQEVAFFDVIEYDGKYYECNKKHVKSSSTTPLADYETNKGSGNWKLSVQFSMVAAKVLWSLIGRIEFFGSQSIIVGSSKTNQRVVIEDGLLKMFGLVNKTQPNIVFGTDETGASVLSYYGNDGKFLYNLGPSGLDASGMTSSSFDEVVVAKVSDVAGKTAFSSSRKFGNGKYYEACSDYDVQKNLFGTSAMSESSGTDQSGYRPVKDKIVIKTALYRYTAARIGNTYASDSAKGLTSAELAGKANGKFFTSKTELAKNGQLTNLASGEYIKESEMVLLNLMEMSAAGALPKYRLRIYKYAQGISTGRYIYSIVDTKSGGIV